MEQFVIEITSLLWEITCHMGSHSSTCHPAAVIFPPLCLPKLVLDLATPQRCKAELICGMGSVLKTEIKIPGFKCNDYYIIKCLNGGKTRAGAADGNLQWNPGIEKRSLKLKAFTKQKQICRPTSSASSLLSSFTCSETKTQHNAN